MLFLNWSKTILQPIKDSSPADHDRSANESRSVTRRIMISYPMNQRLFTNRSKTLCQRTRDFSPTNQRLLTKQSRISHSNNQIFFYNRYNAFINLFRILSITIYTLIPTISCSHFGLDKITLHNKNIFFFSLTSWDISFYHHFGALNPLIPAKKVALLFGLYT